MGKRVWLVLASVIAVLVVASLAADSHADPAIDSQEADFLVRINDYRAQNGLGPLVLDAQLNQAADWFSTDMANDNYFPHDHIDNETPPRNPQQRANAYGYTAGVGENIAAGTFTDNAAQAFTQWKNSPPHNANMLNANYKVIGIARAFNANSVYSWYWTTDFGLVQNPGPPPPTPTSSGNQTQTQSPSPTPATHTPTPKPHENAILDLIGCKDNSVAATDDGSSNKFTTSFPINFFGQTYNGVYVNNNGNVTFDGQLSTYTPFGLQGTSQKIIALFFADVDTRGSGSSRVTFGNAVYSGNRTFCADWTNVGYYSEHADKLNSFQLLLVERADQGAGDFDIMMNFDKVKWETGDANGGTNGLGGTSARMGYSNGVNQSFEYPGSGTPGSFLDSKATGLIHSSENSLVDGRYVYFVRNGAPATGGTLSGKVYAGSVAPENILAGSPVQICGAPGCYTEQTNDLGEFVIRGLDPANYNLRVFPGNNVQLIPHEFGPYTMPQDGAVTGLELVLQPAVVPPADTTITSRTTSGSIPVVYWGDQLALRTTGCPGGTARYEISQGDNKFRTGDMSEDPAGQYVATVAPLAPVHGQGFIHIEITCPSGPPQTKDFDIYIDPSGVVKTVDGTPIDGARVTLYRAENAAGPFQVVPNGDAVMSPVNRTNPDVTDGEGHFGWDVIAGFYKVRAEKAGCVSPDNPQQAYAETGVLEIPPPVTDLDIRLDCSQVELHFAAGDIDCNGAVEGLDGLQIFRYFSQLAPSQGPECPQLGGAAAASGAPTTGFVVGDIDCNGVIDVRDALAVLAYAAGIPAPTRPQGCPVIGQ